MRLKSISTVLVPIRLVISAHPRDALLIAATIESVTSCEHVVVCSLRRRPAPPPSPRARPCTLFPRFQLGCTLLVYSDERQQHCKCHLHPGTPLNPWLGRTALSLSIGHGTSSPPDPLGTGAVRAAPDVTYGTNYTRGGPRGQLPLPVWRFASHTFRSWWSNGPFSQPCTSTTSLERSGVEVSTYFTNPLALCKIAGPTLLTRQPCGVGRKDHCSAGRGRIRRRCTTAGVIPHSAEELVEYDPTPTPDRVAEWTRSYPPAMVDTALPRQSRQRDRRPPSGCAGSASRRARTSPDVVTCASCW